MGKIKNADVLSLDTTKQKEVVKETKQLKNKIKDGTIKVVEAKRAHKLALEQSRGLLYISHLPHGFFEEELKKYFRQFGKVTNVKVCRSSNTGRSKGYGYVEFAHPEVAKIAAETMNNYLMFKKRVTAEFVPYEKRPKGLFIGKPTKIQRVSREIRRQKQHQVNAKASVKTLAKRHSLRMSRLKEKLERLQQMGVKTTYIPENIAVIKQESKQPLNEIYQADMLKDSDDKIDVSVKKSSKSIKSTKSSKSLPEKSGKKLSKTSTKSKSLTSIKSSTKTAAVKKSKTSQKKDVATSSPTLNEKPKNKKRSKLTNAGITKKSKKQKPAPLNSETVRKIARELIRKRGDALLTYPASTNNKSKKKSKK